MGRVDLIQSARDTRPAPVLTAILFFTVSAVVVMRGWLLTDRLPPGDFGGYAAVVDFVGTTVVEDGRMPSWSSKWFAGSTYFMSSFKEYVTMPLLLAFEPVAAVKVMTAITRVAGALVVYLLFARYLGSPLAGALAGWCYAFGAASAHLTRHLDYGFSSVLFPLVLYAAIESARTNRRRQWMLLGALLGVQFCVNYVQAAVAWGFAAVAVFAVTAASRGAARHGGGGAARHGWGGAARHGWRGSSIGVTLAILTFGAFAASQIAWFVFDLGNHALPAPIALDDMRRVWSTQSPLVILNRLNWLVDWLPANPRFFPDDDPVLAQSRYLGIVPAIVILCGWITVRRHPDLRRWFVAALLLFLVPFWMSFGPGVMLRKLGSGFGWNDAWLDTAHRLVLVGGGLCLSSAVLLGVLRRADRGFLPVAFDRRLAAVGFICVLFTVSLFDTVSAVVTPLRGLRSPGHFFDLAPLPFYLLLGLAAVAFERRAGARRKWWWVPLAVLIAVDFWPSTGVYYRGVEMEPLRQFRDSVRALPADPDLRILIPPADRPAERLMEQFSLLAVTAPLGVSSNWLPWQAVRQWPLFALSAFAELGAGGGANRAARLAAADGNPLCAIGRFQYALLPAEFAVGGTGWQRREANERFALWRGPAVRPMAYGARDYALVLAAPPEADNTPYLSHPLEMHALTAARVGFDRHLAVVHDFAAPPMRGEWSNLRDGAAIVAVLGDLGADADWPDETRAAFRPLLGVRAEESWRRAVNEIQPQALLDVEYHRPTPEEIRVVIDAGPEPALVVVSEAHHPWWTAVVDDEPTAVLRAQHAFMGIRVAAGVHEIKMRLAPPFWVTLADRVTGLAWLLALAVAAAACLRRLRRPTACQ